MSPRTPPSYHHRRTPFASQAKADLDGRRARHLRDQVLELVETFAEAHEGNVDWDDLTDGLAQAYRVARACAEIRAVGVCRIDRRADRFDPDLRAARALLDEVSETGEVAA